MKQKIDWKMVGIVGILVCLSIPILFYKLGDWRILKWDEARNAVNTLEMLENGQFLVRYFDGQPDAWETKPPLLMWLQILSIKIFGVSEWALRLPSAVATLGILGVFVHFFWHFWRSYWGGHLRRWFC